MAGLLDWVDQKLGTRLGLLASDPRAALAQMNEQAGAFNQASLLATQADRAALRGFPVTPEQAAAKQYVDKVNEDLAMGFAGTTSPKDKAIQAIKGMEAARPKTDLSWVNNPTTPAPKDILELFHGTTPQAAKAIEKSGFDISKSADGTVWFTSNPNIGEVAASGKGAVVKRLLDKSKMKLGGWEEADKYGVDELLSKGYDGLMLKDGNTITYQIFNPEKLMKR